jgi:hypothetical protein
MTRSRNRLVTNARPAPPSLAAADGDPTPEMSEEPARYPSAEAPPQPLVSGTVGDRCVSCGTPLSSDQRYCVACGERRGKARFALPEGSMATAEPSAPPPPARSSRPPRASSGTTIVAGVGTLLLAMGVGVLIGRNSADNVNARPVQAAAPTVVTVGSGAGTPTTAASTGTGKSKKKSSKGKGKGKGKGKAKGSKPTAAQAAKASAAASKVLGSSKNLPPATVTIGQSGHGPGYNKAGKFDGSFFGN